MDSIIYEIKKLMNEIVDLPEGKNFRNIKETTKHNVDYYCLNCHMRVLGDHETKYPPYGKFCLNRMLIHVMVMLDHFKVYKYNFLCKKIFIDSMILVFFGRETLFLIGHLKIIGIMRHF